jgi:hypothetical protein
MNETSKAPLVIALVVVAVLFLTFGGWAMTGMGGGMMGNGWINGGFSWLRIPTLLNLCLGFLLSWMILGKK